MTRSSATARWAYNGDGSTTVFAYTNRIFASSDLQVHVDGAIVATGYTVSGVGAAAGGDVTFTTAPAAGTGNVVIVSDIPNTQQTAYPEGNAFPAASHEDALDKLTALVQQLADDAGRAFRLADSDPATAIADLPLVSTWADKFLAFDASGNPIAAAGTSANLTPVSAFVDTLLSAATAAAFRALVGSAADSAVVKLTTAQELTKQHNFNATALTDAANIAWNLDDNQVAAVTLAGNRTLDNPTNMVDGAVYILTVKQDATGSRTLSYGNAYKWPGGVAPVLSTGANDVDILTFLSDGTSMFGIDQLDFS